VNVFTTHLDAESSGRRATQMRELNSWAGTFAEQRIIVGDFNAWPGAWEISNMNLRVCGRLGGRAVGRDGRRVLGQFGRDLTSLRHELQALNLPQPAVQRLHRRTVNG
jgi:hypothetical protein